jgi:glycerol-3-phosphate dehydrogenase subunit B
MSRYDAIVIGAGLAGLTTAGQLAQADKKVLLVSTGAGALLLASGCIDVLGYHPAGSKEPLKDPLGKLDDFLAERPDHPYQVAGKQTIEAGLNAFLKLTDSGLAYKGSANRNWLLPSTAGAVHPTCLAPTSLANGELSEGGRMLIVGFKELRDFYPGLISDNLNEQKLGVQTAALTITLPPVKIAPQDNVTPIELAHAFERSDFRQKVVKAVKAGSKGFSRIGFPAVLGLRRHAEVLADLEKQLGKTVFEISTLPPSVPGRRLFERLQQAIIQAGGRIIMGSNVIDGAIQDGRVTHIRFETSNRLKPITANNYVLATGGIYGGGIQTDADGGEGQVWETVFNLPVEANSNRHMWFSQGFLDPKGQPFAKFGVKVNQNLNPVDSSGRPIAENLYVAGASIAGYDWTRGRTGDGVAIATATAIARQIM